MGEPGADGPDRAVAHFGCLGVAEPKQLGGHECLAPFGGQPLEQQPLIGQLGDRRPRAAANGGIEWANPLVHGFASTTTPPQQVSVWLAAAVGVGLAAWAAVRERRRPTASGQ